MEPLWLELKGFIGLGNREALKVDLSVPGQIICLTGPNGAGKSTVIDNLHPYLTMPSRATSKFSYFDAVRSSGSKTLVWKLGARFFKTECKWTQTLKTKKGEYFLLEGRSSDGPWGPCVATDGVQSDGKESTYQKCLAELLPSVEVFLSAAFSAQNKTNAGDRKSSDLKGLFGQLISATDLDVKRELVKQMRVSCTGEIAALQGVAATEGSTLAKASSLSVSVAQETRASAQASASIAQMALEAANGGLATLMAQVAVAEEAKQRRNVLQATLLEAQMNAKALAPELVPLQVVQSAQWAQSIVSIEAIKTKLMHLARTVFAARAYDSGELEKATALVGKTEVEIARLREQYKEAVDARNLCGRVPCKGTNMQGQCELLGSQVSVAQSFEKVKRSGESSKVILVGATGTVVAARERLDKISAANALSQRQLMAVQSAINLRVTGGDLLGYLGALDDGFRVARELLINAISDVLENQQAMQEEYDACKALASEVIDAGRATLGKFTEQEKTRLLAVEQMQTRFALQIAQSLKGLAAIAAAVPTQDINAAQAAVTRAQLQLEQAHKAVHAAHAQVELAQAAIVQTAVIERKLVLLNEQIANREQRCSDLRLLEQAFGSQGILALRIDASGPTIAGIANQLLQSTFGARFALRIVTQRSKVDGSLAEDCDVLVSDSQTDEVASLRNKSGGEKVWLDDALARAIAVFLREEKGQVFATFLSDEADGALDQDRKRSFTGMKRESLRLSGMVREIFISHDPDARNEADVVIDISAL